MFSLVSVGTFKKLSIIAIVFEVCTYPGQNIECPGQDIKMSRSGHPLGISSVQFLQNEIIEVALVPVVTYTVPNGTLTFNLKMTEFGLASFIKIVDNCLNFPYHFESPQLDLFNSRYCQII